MKKIKVSRGYYQSGYGKGFKKNPIVWEINKKYYAKDGKATPFQTDLEGYVMLNSFYTGENKYFVQVGLISQHQRIIK